MGIGKTLNELIKLRKTNVNELARNANVSPQTIYAIIKRDNKKADIEVLLKISKVLGVNVDYFFNSDDEIDTIEIDADKEISSPIELLKPQAQVIGANGERIIFNDENLDKDIGEILSRIAYDHSLIDNKGNKIELNKKEYDLLINVLNTFRDITK